MGLAAMSRFRRSLGGAAGRHGRFEIVELYWAVPAYCALYAILGRPNTEGYAWYALMGAISCGLPLLAVRHEPASLITIIAIWHALYYPVAVLVNLMASSPGVYENDLWNGTPAAMEVLTIGMSGLALGAALSRRRRRISWRGLENAQSEIMAIKPWSMLALSLLIIPMAAFKIATQTYYHSHAGGDSEWSEKSALAYGYVGYFEYLVYGAIFVQWQRYIIGRRRRDLIYAAIMTALPVLVMAPSGSRDMAFRGVVPILFVVIARLRIRISLKSIVGIGGSACLLLMALVVMQTYRGLIYYEERDSSTWNQRLKIMAEAAVTLSPDSDVWLMQLGRRLADYPVVGAIVRFFPATKEYRRFENMSYWPLYLLPNPIRPNTPGFDPRDSATLSETVGIWVGGGSTPAMVLGDLYSRFSWIGVFLGMALLGSIFCLLDGRLQRMGFLESMIFGMILLSAAKLPQDSVFGHYLFFTRNLAIVALIAFVLRRSMLKKQVLPKIVGKGKQKTERSA